MNRKTSAMVTGACLGMAAGTAAYMMAGKNSKTMKRHTKNLRKSTGRALRQVGDFIDSVSYMVK